MPAWSDKRKPLSTRTRGRVPDQLLRWRVLLIFQRGGRGAGRHASQHCDVFPVPRARCARKSVFQLLLPEPQQVLVGAWLLLPAQGTLYLCRDLGTGGGDVDPFFSGLAWVPLSCLYIDPSGFDFPCRRFRAFRRYREVEVGLYGLPVSQVKTDLPVRSPSPGSVGWRILKAKIRFIIPFLN